MSSEPKQYYAQRHGRGPKATPWPIEAIRRLMFSAWDKLTEDGYFQEAMGYECVDSNNPGGHEPGSLGEDIGAHFLRTLMLEKVWPYRDHELVYDEDTLYSMAEVLYDLVSAPIESGSYYHSFSNCGWHYNKFDDAAGQERYRQEMNAVLALADPPHAMNDRGLVVELGPPEFRALMTAALPADADEDLIAKRVRAAVARYERHGASIEDRGHAVRDLADVLEALRDDIKTEMLSTDESALFHLANGFGIRHNTRQQQTDYDKAVWLRWAFYVYLATIHAVLRVLERQAV